MTVRFVLVTQDSYLPPLGRPCRIVSAGEEIWVDDTIVSLSQHILDANSAEADAWRAPRERARAKQLELEQWLEEQAKLKQEPPGGTGYGGGRFSLA